MRLRFVHQPKSALTIIFRARCLARGIGRAVLAEGEKVSVASAATNGSEKAQYFCGT
jgi:hypothetical protein